MTESTATLSKNGTSAIKLDPKEKRILKDQIKVIKRKESYFSLYRFATTFDWIIMVFGFLFSTVAGIAMAFRSILYGQMTNYYVRFQTSSIDTIEFSEEINFLVLAFISLAIVTFVATYISITAWVYTGERIARQIRERYFRAVLRQNMAYFDEYGSGDVTSRITSDIHMIQDGISEKASITCLYISNFLASFIIALIINWKMTLTTSVIIPFLMINSAIMNKYSTIFTKRGLEFYSRAGTIADEVISTIRVAVAFGAQKKLSKLYDTFLDNSKTEGFKRNLLVGFSLGIMFAGVPAFNALVVLVGSSMIIDNEISAGEVCGYMSISNFFDYIQSLSLATGASSKIFETIDRVPPIDIASDTGDKPENVLGHIRFKDINFIYPTRPDVKILNDISLDVEPGSNVALVGSSGSGKSTIVSLILRFYDPLSGDIFLDGRSIKSLNLTWLRRQISLVSQEPVLFRTTIAENVSYGLVGSIYENLPDNEKREMIESACKTANAHDFIMDLPDKYETLVGERGILLSGGQKQRIAIARAIIKDPKILLLDEATSALDAQSESVVQDALDKASKGRTTIVIAHRLSTIRNAAKIIVMNNGFIVESGTHRELLDKKGFYSNLVETQQIQQIQQTVKAEENLNITSPKDESVTSFTTIKDYDNPISRDSSSSNLVKQKDDVEMGLKHNEHNYTGLELIKKVAAFNRPECLMLSIGVISSIIHGAIFSIFALIFANVIQAFTKSEGTLRNEAIFWAFMLFIFAGVTFFVSFFQNITLGFASEKLSERLRSRSFASILRQDISFFDDEEHSVGILTSQLSLDVTQISALTGVSLGNLLQITALIFSSVIVSLIVGWKLTLVCICAIPLMIGSGSLRIKMLNSFHQKTKKAYEYSAQIASEGAANIRTVAALTRENHLWEIYHNLLDEPTRQGIRNAYLASIPFAFANCIAFLLNALAFWYGSKLFIANEYDIRKVYTIYVAIVVGSSVTGRFFAYAPDIAKAKSASASIVSILERVPKIDTWKNGKTIETVKGHLKFSNVHFYYPTRLDVQVLQGLNLEVKPGQYAALVGSSGCGKSTVISLIERFYEATDGTITIDEMNIAKMDVNHLRAHMALVSQEPSLYDMTIKENLLLGSIPGQNITQDDLEKVCREANIHEFIIGLPDGYDTRVGAKGVQLSGGQKQRIAIARALIRNPKILLLDEATSALDSESEKVVQKALDAAAHGRTTLAIAHRLSTIQHADIIFVLQGGKVHER
ncbi:28123_t:CDS:2, partial [Racocetra persica]